MHGRSQTLLFSDWDASRDMGDAASSTFVPNMSLPVHRWFRFSAGFSARWVEQVIRDKARSGDITVFDPFSGSATTLIASECVGTESWGVEAHPFLARIARAKLHWRSNPEAYWGRMHQLRAAASTTEGSTADYPRLIYKCFEDETLRELDRLRRAYEGTKDDSTASELAWLTLVTILRRVSHVGTAQWQYVLPRKRKRAALSVGRALRETSEMIYHDMHLGQALRGPAGTLVQSDARTCAGVPDNVAHLVITSPPYPNNYDYADATRLEMSFLREINGWGDLQSSVRNHLVRSCSQHVPESTVCLPEVLGAAELDAIRPELAQVCDALADVRKTKGGKKTYHLMIACYFRDLAVVWHSLRRVCRHGSDVCFVIGDSAPYGVYVPVIPWLSALAVAAGFADPRFEKTRDRNVKWKNRKHRVPLQEGRLWVKG